MPDSTTPATSDLYLGLGDRAAAALADLTKALQQADALPRGGRGAAVTEALREAMTRLAREGAAAHAGWPADLDPSEAEASLESVRRYLAVVVAVTRRIAQRRRDPALLAALRALREDGLSEMSEMESLRQQMRADRMMKLMSVLSNLLKRASNSAAGVIQNIK